MQTIYNNTDLIEVGVDEAGRGPLFGRLYAGACIWPKDLNTNLIKDSKKYTTIKAREEAYDFIINNCISWGVSYVEAKEIDTIGMSKCLMKCMHQAILNTYISPDHILVDGIFFKDPMIDDRGNYSYTTVVKGDNLYYSIASASIIAKVEHDRYILDMCEKFPILKNYDIHNNKGYGTQLHMDAIKKLGLTSEHRNSFKCNNGLPINYNLI